RLAPRAIALDFGLRGGLSLPFSREQRQFGLRAFEARTQLGALGLAASYLRLTAAQPFLELALLGFAAAHAFFELTLLTFAVAQPLLDITQMQITGTQFVLGTVQLGAARLELAR